MAEAARILVLEDDDAMRDMLVDLLGKHGYDVVGVGQAQEAIDLAVRESFDLVVTDIRMEGMSGLDALQEVKQHKPDQASLVVTGYSTEADSIRAIRLGVGDYLKKPFQMHTFVDSVNRLVVRHGQALQDARREACIRRTVLWALQRAAGTEMAEIVALAGRFAAACELSAPAAEELQLALVIHLLGDAPDWVTEGLSPTVGALVLKIQAGMPVTPQARVALSALAMRGRPPEVPAADWLGSQGIVDPDLLEAVATTPTRGRPQAQARGLLSLARAMEEGGHESQGAQAYQRLLESYPTSREAVEASLGQARLARRAGQPEAASACCARALRVAQQLGPLSAGWAALRAALLTPERELASRWLHQAGRTFEEARLEEGMALARLALCRLAGGLEEEGRRALHVLSLPQHQEHLLENASWLLPLLLESEPLEQAALVLVRNCPGELERALGSLSVVGRRNAAAALIDTPEAAAALQQLSSDPDPQVRQAVQRAQAEAGAAPAQPLLRLFSLGPFEVYRAEQRVAPTAWKSQKVRYLLAWLAAEPGRLVPEDLLLDAFWPDDLERGRQNLYTATSYLRSTLRPRGEGGPDYVLRSPAGLQLNPSVPVWHDLTEFETAVTQGSRLQGSEEGLACLRRAAGLYRGSYLEGCYLEWAQVRRTYLERRVVEALILLGTATLAQGRYQEAVEHAQRLLELDPCCQEAYRLLMQAYLASGRPEEVVKLYRGCQKVLAEEMGVEPTAAVQQLHQQALQLSGE